jgi:hypothetical protein
MKNIATSINDVELETIITELEQGWVNDTKQFDEDTWIQICDELSQEATKSCGLSYDVFVKKFSVEIGCRLSKLPKDFQECAVEIARSYGYATEEELDEMDEWNRENGYCIHGIELGCCPAGCE